MHHHIPAELRALPQWIVWRYVVRDPAKKPTKEPVSAFTGYPADVTLRENLAPFDVALWAASTKPGINGIGFAFTPEDPYCGIDLDTYDPLLSDEDRDRHRKIAEAFTGYAELSPSGKGLHLIVKAEVPEYRKRAGVEICSAGRYLTFTGNVWRNGSIDPQQSLTQTLWDELRDPEREQAYVLNRSLDAGQTKSDEEIYNIAINAKNGGLFKALWDGQWQAGYPSQSEADLALLDILAYYTQNRDQLKRMFRLSGLGKREKAQRDQYFDSPKYGMLHKVFDNRPPEVDIDALKANIAASMKVSASPVPQAPDDVTLTVTDTPPTPERTLSNESNADEAVYAVPPGLLGEIARYFYSSAPRQVPEIALCAAIGLMAGIAGRAYNTHTGTGLNLFLLMLANTGSGKESMAGGVARLMKQVVKTIPAAKEFIGPGEFRSDAALLKYIAKAPSFVTITGEFGIVLQQMSSPTANSHIKGMKRVLLDLFGKSGKGSQLNGSEYSQAEDSTKSVDGPAFTMVGESAPESFFQAVDENLITDGLLPRFTLIEYRGPQPPLSPTANHPPDAHLVAQVATLCSQALMLNTANEVFTVVPDEDAERLLADFEKYARHQVNASSATEVTRQIWNRAHLRALRLAGLVAVGCNGYAPVIKREHAEWAINLSRYNTARLLERFERGEVGNASSDDKHQKAIISVIAEYMRGTVKDAERYSDFPQLHDKFVVPWQYVQRRLVAVAAFRNDRRGSTVAMKVAMNELVDSGIVAEVSKQEMATRFGITAKAYMVTKADAFLSRRGRI